MSWTVRLAEAHDGAALDRLRGLPMVGPIRLALTVPALPEDRIAVAERDGSVQAMGVRTRRQHEWDGIRQSVGVLSGMRSAIPTLPRRAMARMYALLREARAADEPDWELTSILERNAPARRLLEAGLPGMPRYTPAARVSTLTFLSGAPSASGEFVGTRVRVDGPDGSAVVEREPGRMTRVEGYAGALARWRPLVDRVLRWSGRPGLPPTGTVLSEVFATEVRWQGRAALAGLVDGIRQAGRTHGAKLVHWGVPSSHPDLPWLKARLRAWETRSVVYAVHDADRTWVPPAELRVEVGRL